MDFTRDIAADLGIRGSRTEKTAQMHRAVDKLATELDTYDTQSLLSFRGPKPLIDRSGRNLGTIEIHPLVRFPGEQLQATLFLLVCDVPCVQHRCPDCSVTMENVEFSMGDAWNAHITTGEKRTGLLGKLGMNETKDLVTVMCPECGLVRHYAEFEE